jgi:S-adenosylmethionine/arginine decarboxylase-like enzyme
MIHLGWHWLGQLSGCDPVRLRDPAVARRLLLRLAEGLALTPLGGPQLHLPGDGRLVAVLLLADSHASLHVPAEGDGAFVDVFSCHAELDAGACEALVREVLAPARIESRTVRRASP